MRNEKDWVEEVSSKSTLKWWYKLVQGGEIFRSMQGREVIKVCAGSGSCEAAV